VQELIFNENASPALTNSGKTISVSGGSQVVLLSTPQSGKSATVAAGGELFVLSGVTASLDGATISSGGTMTVDDSGTLALKGHIGNGGGIVLASIGNATTLSLSGTTLLTGSGDVVMSDAAPAVPSGITNEIIASGTTAASSFGLINSDNTVRGAGIIGDGDATLKLSNLTSATINADGTNGLTIDTGNAVTNAGLLESTGTGGLVIDDAVKNTGTIAAEGGNVTINGNLTGSGGKQLAQIFSGDRIELKGTSDSSAISFHNNGNTADTGVLVLDHSAGSGSLAAFKGTIANFAYDGTNSDELALQDINFASGVSWAFKENATGQQGVLAVKDGLGDTANLTLMGQYLAANGTAQSGVSSLFQLSGDTVTVTGTAGTLVATSFKQ
jgi:hypothetical protein